ncbi:MAG: CRTAC1 family protein [bacterium]
MASRLSLALIATAGMVAGVASAEPALRDVSAECGIDFVHANGATGGKNYYEVMGSGVALLDFDGDGRLDVYCVTCVGPNRLYRNVGEFRFEEMPGAAGAADEGYGMGAVAADADGDGDPDLYVTNFGANALYRNDGGARFVRVTAGAEDDRWGCGASFLDYDRDGVLDLYVVNYVQCAVPDTNVCPTEDGHRLYCGPRRYPRAADVLLRGLGGLRFEDVSEKAGVAGVAGRGLGVIAFDADRDSWPDLYVANDLDPNFLFRNLGDGTFEEIGILSGVSHSEDGMEESGMGVAAGDYDRDGWLDLFVTNYVNETNTLYHNEGDGFFLDVSAMTGVGPSSLPWISWGTEFLDWDLDGWPDLLVVNGHTESEPELVDPTTTWKQRGFLYRNVGEGRFEDVTQSAAPALLVPQASRAAAFGDLDDDGDVDVLVQAQNAPLLVLRNTTADANWIGVSTRGTRSNRDGVGARVEVHTGDVTLVRERQAGGSYLSSNDPRLAFGLGTVAAVDSVVVAWPSGTRSVLRAPEVGRYHEIVESED